MGVNLSDILEPEKVDLEHFSGRVLAIDAYNTLYQYLSIIRQPDGTPLSDSKGNTTSHLAGLFYRTSNFLELGIRPVFVFDGKPSYLKSDTLHARSERKKEAKAAYEKALEEGDLETARTKAQQTSKLTLKIAEEAKHLLDIMGLPWVQPPDGCEGEAQASHMASRGDVWAAASQDFDSLLFGTPLLVRNMTVTGRRKLPYKNQYITVEPEIIRLENVLAKLGISREQLIDLALMIGTDYNPGIRGIGPKTGLKYMKEFGNLETIMNEKGFEIFNLHAIRDLFMNPNVQTNYKIEWGEPDVNSLKQFLCQEHEFSENRIDSTLKKLQKAADRSKQKSLDAFF